VNDCSDFIATELSTDVFFLMSDGGACSGNLNELPLTTVDFFGKSTFGITVDNLSAFA